MTLALERFDGPRPHPNGERMVFLVASERNPAVRYRVDLLANNGAGWCQCTDFATRKQPAIDAGGEAWTRGTTCKHLRKCGRYFLRDLLQAMAKSECE